jgi:glycerol-3-phosphate dehydrogenase (NAD(P)+)
MNSFLILGTGAFGTALSQVLLDNNKSVRIWGINEIELKEIEQGINNKYFPGLKMSKPPQAYADLQQALEGVEVIVFAIPSKAVKETIIKVNKFLKSPVIFINTAKGFDTETGQLMNEIFSENSSDKVIGTASLVGPSFAIELFNRNFTFINCVSSNLEICKTVKADFENSYLKCKISDNYKGAEIVSSMKNTLAILTGLLYGLNYQINTVASVITRGMQEISSYLKIKGISDEILKEYCGVGDILLTCMSSNSRNYSFGYKIAQEKDFNLQDQDTKVTAEGFKTAKIIHQTTSENPKMFPLFETIYKVLYENLPLLDVLSNIFSDNKN